MLYCGFKTRIFKMSCSSNPWCDCLTLEVHFTIAKYPFDTPTGGKNAAKNSPAKCFWVKQEIYFLCNNDMIISNYIIFSVRHLYDSVRHLYDTSSLFATCCIHFTVRLSCTYLLGIRSAYFTRASAQNQNVFGIQIVNIQFFFSFFYRLESYIGPNDIVTFIKHFIYLFFWFG